MSKSVLLIHPDRAVRRDVRVLLTAEDLRLAEAGDLGAVELGNPNLLLIDWHELNPPRESLHWMKRNGRAAELRIIVLSDRVSYADAVRSLQFGADDCVLVPLQGDELLVRVRVALRRPQTNPLEATLIAGPIVLDRSVHRVSVNDEAVELAPTEFRLLAFLLENQGRVFSRSELLTRAWSNNVRAGQRTVDVHVRRLRQQLEPYRCAEMIQTVRGFGYRLRAD